MVKQWIGLVWLTMVSGTTLADETPLFRAVDTEQMVQFAPTQWEPKVPDRFQLPPHTFPARTSEIRESGPVKVFKVTFPSHLVTRTEVNNTVHGEYYLPAGEGPFPGVVVLHILGGEFPLSQMTANALARAKVAALFIKMPYYGERRERGNQRRMISRDPDETIEGMTQAVFDIRRAAAFLRARPEIDDDRLGVTGISLGGIMSALSAPAEPTFRKVAIYLGGGNLAEILWERDLPDVVQFRQQWIANGGTRQSFLDKLGVVDPAKYGTLIRDRDVLMVAAKNDEIIPPEATTALYEAIGKRPELVWLDAGHITAAKDIFGELLRLQAFFTNDRWPKLP